MDVNELIDNRVSVDAFIGNNFESVDSSYKNPIFPYRVNLADSGHRTMFCDLPTVDAWALKHKGLFTIFTLVKNRPDLVDVATAVYGPIHVESRVTIGDFSNGSATYLWTVGNLKIMLSKFINVEMVPKYDDCVLVIVGNMPYHDIVHLGD